ncbi:MAG: DNA repair protein RecO [Desulfuromonadales bacterium]|nr:DNA repair protein RecO [Desulfuromonadales bacterium]
MHPEKLQAFVLATIDYGDSDRIVSLFTLEHGRIKAFARRARNSRKRFGAALETFARIEAQVGVKQGLSGLQQADIFTVYPGIRADLAKIAHALYACELVDAMTPEGHPLPRLFRLLAAYLDRLESAAACAAERRFFEINLLNILGYRPSLEVCTRCDNRFDELGALQQDDGELVCPDCTAHGRALTPVTLTRLLACLGTGTFGLVDFPVEALAQAGVALDDVLTAHAGRRLKSLEFLRQIGG